MLEGVQKRATKMIKSLRKSSYDEILKRLSMFSLRRRRLRGDMIEVFKMIQGIDKVNLGKLFSIDEKGRTRKQFMFKNWKTCLNSNIGLKISLEELLIIGTTSLME